MARSSKTDPLRNFKFQVEIVPGGSALLAHVGPSIGNLGFAVVSGISTTNEVIMYREGGMNAQPAYSKVLTPTGWTTMGELEVGDQVVDPATGNPSEVLGIYPKGEREVFRVTLRDGSSTVACYDHLWKATCTGHYIEKVVTTLEIRDIIESGEHVWLPEIAPIQYDVLSDLPIDPYLLGVLLSEGNLQAKHVSFAQDDSDESGKQMVERCRATLPEGLSLRRSGDDGATNATWHLTTGTGSGSTWVDHHGKDRNPVQAALRVLGLDNHRSWEKFVPDIYKHASAEDRLALLQGILDGDGSVSDTGRITFSSSSKQLRDDVAELINSLGGRCTRRANDKVMFTSPNQIEPKAGRTAYEIGSVQIQVNPFFVEDKASKFIAKNAAYHRAVISVESIGVEEVQCIEVSAESHLYITDDFIPTHNTAPHKMIGQSDWGPITFSKGLFAQEANLYNWQTFLNSWNQGGVAGGSTSSDNDYRADIIVSVFDHPVSAGSYATPGDTNTAPTPAGNRKLAFKLHNAWPASWSLTDLNAGDSSILIQQLVVNHEGASVFFAPDVNGVAPYPGAAD